MRDGTASGGTTVKLSKSASVDPTCVPQFPQATLSQLEEALEERSGLDRRDLNNQVAVSYDRRVADRRAADRVLTEENCK